MAEEKVRCKIEFDEFLGKTTEWVEKQRRLLEVKPTPEKIEEITKLYTEVIKKGKEFAECEVAGS